MIKWLYLTYMSFCTLFYSWRTWSSQNSSNLRWLLAGLSLDRPPFLPLCWISSWPIMLACCYWISETSFSAWSLSSFLLRSSLSMASTIIRCTTGRIWLGDPSLPVSLASFFSSIFYTNQGNVWYLVKDVSCGFLELWGVSQGLKELVLTPTFLLSRPINLLEDVGVIPIRHSRADTSTGRLNIIMPKCRISSYSTGCPGILGRGL
jgi:hypothetical protein